MSDKTLLRELVDVAVGNDKTLTTDTETIGLKLEVIAITYFATSGIATRTMDVVLKAPGGVELQRLVAVLSPTADDELSAYIYPGSGDGEFAPFVLRPLSEIQVVDTTDFDVLDKIEVRAYFEGTGLLG